MSESLSDWLRRARARLGPAIGAETAARETRLMVAHATGWSTARIGVGGSDMLPEAAQGMLEAMLVRRMAREPLAQILGEWAFYGRAFTVTRDTLTPRSDTEMLVDLALEAPFSRLLDLGTGTGAIAVSLLAERQEAAGVATDISAAALAVAAGNAARHRVDTRLELVRADWWQGVEGGFDLIVSNPPYVTGGEYAELAPEIILWEPRGALTPDAAGGAGGGDGLMAYRAILDGVGAHLLPGGRLLVEIGATQGAAVAGLFRQAGLRDLAVHADINGKPRVVAGVMPLPLD